MKKQRGIVLFFSLIVLIIMTVIGVALAVNSTQSLRMSGAGSEFLAAKALADGGVSAVLLNKPTSYFATLAKIDPENGYSGGIQTLTPLPLVDDGTGTLVIDPKDVACQRSQVASGTNLFSCRRIQISSEVKFGRSGFGRVSVVTGIEQEVLNGSGV
jgi:type IV pilus assembly protein PilX